MDRKEAEKIAKQVVKYLFSDGTGKRVERLMLVYEGQSFGNPGWGRESITDVIADKIMDTAKKGDAP